MRNFFILITVVGVSILNAQKINTPYFSFQGDGYIEVENQYNSKNKTYNYTYALDENNFYMFSVMYDDASDKVKETYLNTIRDSGVSVYRDITFEGVRAITTEKSVQSGMQKGYSKDLLFFKNNYFYTIIMVSTTQNKVKSMFENLKSSLNLKN